MTSLAGRFPLCAAFLSAILIWLASPGGGELVWLLPLVLLPLLIAISQLSPRRAFWAGFCCGCLSFVTLLYWIVFVLGRYGGLSWYLSVPALLLLAAYMAVYTGLFAAGAALLLACASPLTALLTVPALWVGLDWLRGVLFGGFPWLDLGYFLASSPLLIQSADLFGHHGLTYLLLLTNVALTLIAVRGKNYRQIVPVAGLLLVMVLGYSWWRWQQVQQLLTVAPARMQIGVVQGNIDQGLKWSPENQQATVATYLRHSRALFTGERPELLVWPETALPFYPVQNPHLADLQGLAAQYDTALLTGAPWYEKIDGAQRPRFYNSALLLEPDGQFSGTYFKTHLVPFGEYVPLQRYLPFIAPLVQAVGDFTAGAISQPLAWRQAQTGVLICYESIFADIARQWVDAGANVLINLTNDAWYGRSSAPHHSLAMTVLRAVETRRSLVRSANTGISAFIDPLGRLQSVSPLFVEWAQRREVALLAGRSFFVRGGHFFAPLCLILAGLLVAGCWRQGLSWLHKNRYSTGGAGVRR